MVAFSSIARNGLALTQYKNVVLPSKFSVSLCKGINLVQVRHCKGKHDTFNIVPSNFTWTKIKDMIHFYFMVGMIPVLGIVMYSNIFIGPATLQPIPEGYRPQRWEYHSHPISRFIRRYFTEDYQKEYEKACYKMFYESERILAREVERRVKFHVKDRRDFQSWYYSPTMTKYSMRAARNYDKMEKEWPYTKNPMGL